MTTATETTTQSVPNILDTFIVVDNGRHLNRGDILEHTTEGDIRWFRVVVDIGRTEWVTADKVEWLPF